MSAEFLFIRLLEACNAGCFMCEFADSKDKYRLSKDEFARILDEAQKSCIKYIRFTGGEPLMHRDIISFISMIHERNIKSSIITNGFLLSKKVKELADAHLDQIIVSLDGPTSIHDNIRNRRGLFDEAIKGLKLARSYGIKTRVNSVVGPENFRYMPQLQNIFTDIGVEQWEMSSLKLEKPLDYSQIDIKEVDSIIHTIFTEGKQQNKLVPFGKIWCGDTVEERERYFSLGITPSADRVCHIVDKVRYLDAKNKRFYTCSLIPHRPEAEKYAVQFVDLRNFQLENRQLEKQADFFRAYGPNVCTGCSTTASGCSNLIDQGAKLAEWYY